MHQDVWSRYCGGSGAPAWTLGVIGLIWDDASIMEGCRAAWLGGVRGGAGGGGTETGGLKASEKGLWPTGYQKLAAASMNTVFWAGDVFAPKLRVNTKDGGIARPGEESVDAKTFLQERFLGAWEVLVRAVGGLECVLGFQVGSRRGMFMYAS